MTQSTLRADCAQCAALCCVALAFDRGDMFAFDKKAGEPCPHLRAASRCAIHGERRARGFAGCVGYDCLGAGQAVTQTLFGGRSWREEPALLPPMIEAFAVMREAHALVSILRKLRPRLEAALQARADAISCALEAGGPWSGSERDRLTTTIKEAKRFLRLLRATRKF